MKPADLYFGGSFDPIHNGHLFAAQEAMAGVGADSVLFVPTGRNPLKPDPRSAGVQDRYEMVRRAVVDNPAFRISDIELTEDAPSYTVETVRRLIDKGLLSSHPGLIIGDDLLRELSAWREIDALLSIVQLVVVTRHGIDPTVRSVFPATDLHEIVNPAIPISSTLVRDRLRHGRSVRYLVPDRVYDYIRERGIYN